MKLTLLLLAGCVWIGEGRYDARRDRDQDGHMAVQWGGDDCDDDDPDVRPGAVEVWYDGVDQDCDGANDYDADGDGHVHVDFPEEAGGTAPGIGDCDDADAAVSPSADEVWYDGVDQDCDGANDYDADGDGFVHPDHADRAGGTAPGVDDCDDDDPLAYPGADEIPYDGIDQRCDGFDLVDVDEDGYPGIAFDDWQPAHAGVAWPDGLEADVDCDDTDVDVFPGAEEIWYDGVDQDCDGANDFDQDRDGYVHEDFPTRAGGTAPLQGDCDDQEPAYNPGAECDPLCFCDNNCTGSTTCPPV